jgi:PhoPQ-activated pathogenicity-related protein
MSRRSWLVGIVSAVTALAGFGGPASADLAAYVKRAEPDSSWNLKSKRDVDQGTIYEIELTSQKWQDIVWKHEMRVYLPKDVKPKATMFLLNTGGRPGARDELLGFSLANGIQGPMAILFGIPNQPLLKTDKTPKGFTEDALIAETFLKYLKTKDDSWPLLFPMVKSVTKSMDALQAFARKEWKTEVKDFVLTGASKRGWTTWLTAAVEPRVKAIAPMVIDTLNMQKQMPYQLDSYGTYSAMIHDYTERGLVPMPKTAEARKLWSMVDPWVYRDKLKMPKLILNGTNDPYWTQDALNLYWDDLPGPKYVSYVPNAGHDLNQGTRLLPNIRYAGNVLAAFARSQIDDKPLPKLTWKYEEMDGKYRLKVTSDTTMKAARLWQADASTRDFRKAKWKSEELKTSKETSADVVAPAEGCRVFMIECEYEMDKLRYSLCTQVRIVGQPKKKDEK